jgi:mannose-6-phosphate isomerase-like protein (cupin superfamily)
MSPLGKPADKIGGAWKIAFLKERVMKRMPKIIAILFLFSTAGSGVGAQQSSAGKAPIPATDVTAEVIQATLKDEMASGKPVIDRSARVVDIGGHNVGIGVVYRLSPGPQGVSAVHDKVSEVYVMLEGAGTLVTGGKLVNPTRREGGSIAQIVAQVNGPGVSGTSIEGGVSRRIKAGDFVIIPAGTPHWWSEIGGKSISYVVIRVDPDQVVALK